MTASFTSYLNALETALKAGNATEHTHRPALKTLLESLSAGIIATNEPKRSACGAPDYIVTRQGLTIGYLEAKDVGKSLDDAERTDQLKRYRRALDNLILTDYLEFRWYVDGERRQTARFAQVQSGGKLTIAKDGGQDVAELLHNFLAHAPQGINTPKDLAERLARLTHIIRDIIVTAFETKQASLLLQGWRDAFAKVLIAELNEPEKTPDFADMFAQTLAYGLFTARVMDASARSHAPRGNVPPDAPRPMPQSGAGVRSDAARRNEQNLGFTRHEAQYLIPKSNPFLRDFFIQITGPQLDDEPFASFVDDLVHVLAHTDMAAVLADFGRRTKQEDPVVHFYETFLAAYDPKLRESRGVYYTPEPVVSYIVRSVDHLLKTRFNCPQGLADSRRITIPNTDPGRTVKSKSEPRKTTDCHKVLILDPATGTGTFLYAVIDHIRRQFMQQGNAGMWPGYVKNHLLPRLFGFELLMAPYAVAHFKLSLQLAGRDLPEAVAKEWAYQCGEGERLGVYLTNALQEPHEMTGLPLFTQWVADETNAANKVKQLLPVLVVMGNPPYSVSSSNKSPWIENLMDTYKKAVRSERNIQPLSDDYIKFIRLAQDRIERTEQGIVGIITNHAYLSGLIHRGMREELMKAFTAIYVLNLHGNATIGEIAPDGSADENVFDIRQGVAIALFVKEKKQDGLAEVNFFELWGKREEKYDYLQSNDVSTTLWQTLTPQSPHYFFVPKDFTLSHEYELGWQVNEVFPLNSGGIKTHRDHLVIDFDNDILKKRVAEFLDSGQSDQDRKLVFSEQLIHPYLYRPFDQRNIYYDDELLGRPRKNVFYNLLFPNLALATLRQTVDDEFRHVFVTNKLCDINLLINHHVSDRVFPLYTYPTENAARQKTLLDVSPWPADASHGGRVPNLNPQFVADMAQKLGLKFQTCEVSETSQVFTPNQTAQVSKTCAVLTQVFTPEDIFHYLYAIFHSPTYRTRYAEFLKIDFPRVPLTSDVALFRSLCALGQRLVGLHLLDAPEVGQFSTRYPIAGENRIDKGYPKYAPPAAEQSGRITINKTQYFEGVPPDVWEFYIGGYQPAQKWLKDRQGRQLTYDDLTHYQKMMVALQKTLDIMAEIDAAIPEWPIQ